MAAESYRELRAWKLAMKIAVDCYELTKRFPPEEAPGIWRGPGQVRLERMASPSAGSTIVQKSPRVA